MNDKVRVTRALFHQRLLGVESRLLRLIAIDPKLPGITSREGPTAASKPLSAHAPATVLGARQSDFR